MRSLIKATVKNLNANVKPIIIFHVFDMFPALSDSMWVISQCQSWPSDASVVFRLLLPFLLRFLFYLFLDY